MPRPPIRHAAPARTAPLGRRTARGAVVTLGAQFARILIQIVSVVVLARLLTPDDYGLLAMVVAIVGVGEILRDFGLSSAAVQAPTLSTAQRDNLFWINTGIGAALMAICLAGAPLIGSFYGDDRLVPIMRALAVTFLLNGMATQYRAGLTRRMRFGAIAAVDVATPLIALSVAIVIASLGGGTSALVAQQIVTSAVGFALLVPLAQWLPGLPRRAAMGGFLRFGGWLLASQIITYASKNVDSVVIGLRFGAGAAGIYSRAFQLLMTPLNQVRSPSTSVALPALARVQDQRRRFNDYVKAGQLALSMPLALVLAVVIGAADPAVRVFLGTTWLAAIPVLQWLALAGLFQTLAYVGYWVYLARALTNQLMYYSIVAAVLKIVCIVVGSQWGVVGVAAGYAISHLIEWPISLWWLDRVTTVPVGALYGGALRTIGLGLPVAGAAWGATALIAGAPAAVQLLAAVGAGLAAAAAAAAAVPAIRRDVASILAIARLAIAGRKSA